MATNFKPDYIIHPGVFLKEEMQAIKITQKELSQRTGISKTVINEIIKGKRNINADIAVKLEKVMYSGASYWLNLQALYDEALARNKLGEQKYSVEKTFEGWQITETTETQKSSEIFTYNNDSIVRGAA